MRSFTARAAAAAARFLIAPARGLGRVLAGRRRTPSPGDLRADALVEQHQAESLRFRTALNNMSQGLCFFDGDSRLIVCNDRYAEMYGLSPDLCRPGTPLQQIVDQRYRVGSAPRIEAAEYMAWRASIVVVNQASDTVTELRDGRTFSIHHRPMPDGGWVATHEDITERRRAQEQIARMAHHDALTAIPNRAMFRERLQASLRRVNDGAAIAVLTIDLDGFKAVNDTLGHPAGDAVLQAVAQRLGECVRDDDLVARLGGDEFAIIQGASPHPELVEALGERVVRVMAEPFHVAGHRVLIGASVGAAMASAETGTVDGLLYQADLALYEAKAKGRGRFLLYVGTMGERARDRRELTADLRQAQALGQLELHYQPIFVCSRRPVGASSVVAFEALLRWNHPSRGRVMPDGFIAVAEEIGIIGDIGAWVLRTAFKEAMRWPAEVAVAVNLSPLQFAAHANIVAVVRAALDESGLAASRVELEITESVRLAENAANLATLHRLRELGVRVCLDDFGVGYSSLSYLRTFPFDKIKIDRSFVRDMTSHREAAAIVRAIAALARSLGMSVTAEGVESAGQCASLQEMGCDELQGYWLGRPGPAGEVLSALQGSWTTAERAWPVATAQDDRSRAAA
ncbi:MAG: EAL domain-containing protein [Caldimonas sp.]